MEFVPVPAGRFIIGAFNPPYPVPDDTVKGAKRPINMYMGDGRGYNSVEFDLARTLAMRDKRNGFTVKIKKSFYLGKYEVTQLQWKKIMGTNPSTFKENGDNRPVENVSWSDAQAFLIRLNELDSKYKYRLPTEFEWEYAARAGATDDIPWSVIEKTANLNKSHTTPVGEKAPNAWGLFDMLGNVWEWTNDYYNEKLFADPQPPKRGDEHVLKGASFAGDVKNATYMTHAAGPGNGWDVGFRIVLEQK
ncbi:SUMF1/EgtB/PvdO family nonheme iron enzyme [Chryseolinea sp. T2]|uniref:formylglycine-generating enzyme family protein n=1 Tax=Chryseolinea sp. T2 TaxID=3129255 RepID=UPI003076C0B4